MNKTILKRLYLFQVGSMPEYQIPIVCYLVQTADDKNILIDTGLPEIIPADSAEFENGVDILKQLVQLNVQPEDIDFVISTHYDGDHAGRHSAFTNAQYVVQRAHHADALKNPRFATIRKEWDLPIERILMIDGDTELLSGLRLIETSGHAIGHQSVFLQLPKTGKVLLTIDAVSFGAGFTLEPKDDWAHPDGAEGLASIDKLLKLVEKEKIDLVIFGHDQEQWMSLKQAPEFYE
ncbi:MAG: N-acyl homoserine lactonase family protein [Microgenomates group bacterium]